MLRYKKHKRHADGVAASGVGVMDDTDREVSNFTDRAFRSLCVAEEEPFNDVPRIPSPIRGMQLSTKYHLGIFNLSVRKTQPLAQLPTVPRQRGKWAPTFQPLLNCAKDGLIVAKPNTNKLFVPQPTGYKQRSKVSSLIKTFDNIENERPEEDELPSPKVIQRGKMTTEEEPLCETVRQTNINNALLESIKTEDMTLEDSHNLHRRTAREVFLESQAEICSMHSGSPSLLGSPIPDQTKKVEKQKECSRRTTFLHSENSAFKSWSDIHKRHTVGDESDSSIPGTPPLLRPGTPCSPLLQRITPRTRAREAGSDVGWGSPASTISNTYDPIQMLRTVPPLPTKRISKQNRELSHRTPKVHSANKIQAEDMQTEVTCQSPKEQLAMMTQSKSPTKLYTHPGTEEAAKTSHPLQKQNEETQERVNSTQEAKKQEMTAKGDDVKISNKPLTSSGRIKTLIQQIKKETVKDVSPFNVPEKKNELKELKDDNTELLPATSFSICPNPSSPLSNIVHVPPWRRTNTHKIELEEKTLRKPVSMKESATEQLNGSLPLSKEDSLEDRPSISSFNIINLLTPVISRKSIQEALEEQPMTITPPPAKTVTLTDQDQEEIHLYRKRNEYKSKAPSLLFNLKDVRKRVKCTYNSATNPQNVYENNQTADGRIQDTLSKDNTGNGINKLPEREDVSNTDQAHVLLSTKQNKHKAEFIGNASDNYLSLSSPPQVTVNKVLENVDIHPKKDHQDEDVPKQYTPSSQLSPVENTLTKYADYPVLNIYSKEGIGMNVEQKENGHVEQAWRKKSEPIPLQDENVKQESKGGTLPENGPIAINNFLERELDNAERHTNQTENSIDIERLCSAESDEGGKEEVKNDSMMDEILYYAVSNSKTGRKEEYEVLDTEREENVEDKRPQACDNQGDYSTNAEEIKRPSSIIPSFKPNLFQIKDNKVRSSPVTKSVRPLLRSLSEDCLIFHKDDEYNFVKQKGNFRIAMPNVWKNKDTQTNTYQSGNMKVHNDEKHWRFLATKPEKDRKYKGINMQNDETDKEELWRKISHTTQEWRQNEAETAESVELIQSSNNTNSPRLNEPFFHPVETCVSEVTGLSPECNALLGHHINESMKAMVNGEQASSPVLDTADTTYSSLENGQFEDAVSFSEDIACSTITSPMSESITCSMVASPMSVNTQSSGFATALSALDDISSPPLTYANSKTEKCSFLVPDISTPSNLETKTHEFIKQSQEKETCLNMENMAQAAKPPAVPPKTEKALRRAKRLTKKRRKTDIPQRIQEGILQESDLVLDVPSPASIIPTTTAPQSTFKPGPRVLGTLQQEELISESSTPSLPTTQRKLLQDPDSGQYFVVDIPVHFRIKTFYDPETGKYLQMSLPPSERSTPTLDISNSPFTLYQRLAPVPVTSIASLKQASHLLNHNHLDIEEKAEAWLDGEDNCLKMQQLIDCDSCDQSMTGTPHSMDKIANRTRSPDIISMGDIEDFAMEAIS